MRAALKGDTADAKTGKTELPGAELGMQRNHIHGLFRTEALEAAAESLSKPMGIAPPAGWVLATLFVLLCVLGLSILALGTYTRRESARGTLRPSVGLPSVASGRSGIVSEVRVQDGSLVRKGDVLFVLSAEEASSSGARIGEELQRLQTIQASSRLDQYQADLAKIDRQIAEATQRVVALDALASEHRSNVELQMQRLAMAERTLSDVEPLRASKLLSEVDYKRYAVSVLDGRQAVSSARREVEANRLSSQSAVAEQRVLREERRSLISQRQATAAQLQENSISLQQNRSFAVVAPRDGQLASTSVRLGDPVTAGAAIAVIVPSNTRLTAELDVPSSAIGFVRNGDKVRLMFDAFKYERFGFGEGVVRNVSGAPIGVSNADSGMGRVPIYRVSVELGSNAVTAYGRRWPLTPGMGVTADLLLEERSFLQWILDPIRAAVRRT